MDIKVARAMSKHEICKVASISRPELYQPVRISNILSGYIHTRRYSTITARQLLESFQPWYVWIDLR
jgi:hypothetical protein